jgi:hypothetical protein
MNFHGSFWAGGVYGWCEPRKTDSFKGSDFLDFLRGIELDFTFDT